MNKERILDLADIIENDRLSNTEFNMSVVIDHRPELHSECGTAGCIAGFTVIAAYGNREAKRMYYAAEDLLTEARRILGLNVDEARELFWPLGWSITGHFTPKHAAAVLRHFANTGNIDWSIAR